MRQISPCLTTLQAEIQEALLLLCHHCQSGPQNAGPLSQHIYPNHLSQDSYPSNIPSYQYQTISSLERPSV